MKFNMVCIKFDQKIKKNLKNLNFDFSGFLGFFKKPKKPRLFRSHFPALVMGSLGHYLSLSHTPSVRLSRVSISLSLGTMSGKRNCLCE